MESIQHQPISPQSSNKKWIIITIIILTLSGGIFTYTKYISDTKQSNTTSSSSAATNPYESTAEMKSQAIKMFIKSRELYEADNLLGILTYVEETNDKGELDDFKTQTGLSVADAKKALEKSPRDPSKPNASNAKLVQMMSFISEDFFKKMPNVNWQVTKNPDTGSTDVLAEFENIVTINSAGDTRLAMCLLGATQLKDGTWRALPIAAFRCE